MNPLNIEKIFKALNAAQVHYLVVGGLAVMAHGYLRMTRDLDLVIALDGANPERALKVFQQLGYHPNVPVQLMDFASAEKRNTWKQEKGMVVYPLISSELNDCPIDLFIEEPIAFSEMYPARVEYQLSDNLSVPVVGLSHLRQMKQAAGRPRDLLDLEELDHHNASE